MNAIQDIALIFILLSIVKLFVVLTNKKAWYENVARPIFYNKPLSTFVFFVLAVIVFYYLIQELSFAQIFAVIAFTALLVGLGFLQYSEHVTGLMQKMYSKRYNSWQIFYILIWVVLIIAALYEILR